MAIPVRNLRPILADGSALARPKAEPFQLPQQKTDPINVLHSLLAQQDRRVPGELRGSRGEGCGSQGWFLREAVWRSSSAALTEALMLLQLLQDKGSPAIPPWLTFLLSPAGISDPHLPAQVTDHGGLIPSILRAA